MEEKMKTLGAGYCDQGAPLKIWGNTEKSGRKKTSVWKHPQSGLGYLS